MRAGLVFSVERAASREPGRMDAPPHPGPVLPDEVVSGEGIGGTRHELLGQLGWP